MKEQQEAAQVAGELFAKVTGDLAKKFEFEDGSKEKIAMHALAGALAAKMSDGNVATDAAAGAGSEWLNTYVTDYLNEQAKDLKLDAGQKEKLKQAAQQMTALVIGAAAGAVSGGTSETMKQGALTSYNAETYNRQLHQNEKERIKLLANGDEEKERRLEIAACALVHCSAQIPEDDPRYAAEYQKEILGNTAEFANERSLLQKQTYTLDSWGAGASYPLFNYNLAYKMQDYDDAHTQIVTRAGGVAQTAYGIGTAVGGGVTSCMGLATCGFGVVAGLYGLDHTLAGVKTIWTGKASQTAGGDFISKTFGMEQGSGELLYGFANPHFVTSVGNVAKLPKVFVSSKGQNYSNSSVDNFYVSEVLRRDYTSPMGSRYNQMNQPKNPSYQTVRNKSDYINGREYSGHALDRMQDRGILPSVVEHTIKTGSKTTSELGVSIHKDNINGVKVITNDKGKVITVTYER